MIKPDLKLLGRVIRSENVISITFSDGDRATSGEIDLFFSNVDVHRFTQLRSLTFHQKKRGELQRLAELMQGSDSVASSNATIGKESSRTLTFISAAVAQSSLVSLHLNNNDYLVQHITWPHQCTIQKMSIVSCDCREYHLLLSHLSSLRTLTIGNYPMFCAEPTLIAAFADGYYAQLTSLTMSTYWKTDDICLLLGQLPSLEHISLDFSTERNNLVYDASMWEQFIRTHLPLLKELDFFFGFQQWRQASIAGIEPFDAPFRTPFWLEERHQILTCNYAIATHKRMSFRTLESTVEFGIMMKWQAMPGAHMHHLSNQCENETTDAIPSSVGDTHTFCSLKLCLILITFEQRMPLI